MICRRFEKELGREKQKTLLFSLVIILRALSVSHYINFPEERDPWVSVAPTSFQSFNKTTESFMLYIDQPFH